MGTAAVMVGVIDHIATSKKEEALSSLFFFLYFRSLNLRVTQIKTKRKIGDIMIDSVKSINEYMDLITNDGALESKSTPQTRNGNGSNNGNQNNPQSPKYIHMEEIYSRSKNMQALQLWYTQFKPQWAKLRRDFKNASTVQAQEAVLWKEKTLLLETREAILNIPESAVVNVACFVGILAVTFGLSVCIFNSFEAVAGVQDAIAHGVTGSARRVVTGLTVPGFSHPTLTGQVADTAIGLISKSKGIIGTTIGGVTKGLTTVLTPAVSAAPTFMSGVGVVSECIGTVYTVLKAIALASKMGDTTGSYINQKKTGVMSKQLLIMRVNGYIGKVDAQIREVMAGKVATLNNQVAKAVEKFSDKYAEKVMQAANTSGQKLGDDMADHLYKYMQGDKAKGNNGKNKGNGNNSGNKNNWNNWN